MIRNCLGAIAMSMACVVLAQEAPKAPPKPWLKVAKSANGFIVGGFLDDVLYGFEIPGSEIRSVGKENQPLIVVDGVFIQMQAVRKREFASLDPDVLEAFRKYEQKYQLDNYKGVTFSDHDFCANAKVRHGQWVSEVPPPPQEGPQGATRTPYQVYVTFEVGDSVLMVGSAYGNDDQKKAMARKLDAICRSFVRER